MESTSKEKAFYDALGAVPGVPAGVLGSVERSVRRSGVKRRATLAACLLLAFIIPALVITQKLNTSVAYAEDNESMDELFYAFEYMSGSLDGDYLLDMDADADSGANAGGDGQVSLASEKNSPAAASKTVSKKHSKKELSNEN